MGNQADILDFQKTLEANPSTGPVEESGFSENFAPALTVFMNEDTSVGEYINSGAYRERDRKLDDMINSGAISKETYAPYVEYGTGIDYSKMAYDLKRQDYEVMDDYDVRDNIREDLRMQRDVAQEIHQRADWAGTAGIFLGQATAAQLDPVNAAAMLIPGLAAVRMGTAMARAGQAALYYGGASAAAETLIQPQVYKWKEEIGVEYGAGDAILNIGLAGVAGGAFGVVVDVATRNVVLGFRAIRKKLEKDPTIKPMVRKQLMEEMHAAEVQYIAHVEEYRRMKAEEKKAYITELKIRSDEIKAKIRATLSDDTGSVVDELDMLQEEFDAILEEMGPAPKSGEPTDLGLERDMRVAEDFQKRVDKARVGFIQSAWEMIKKHLDGDIQDPSRRKFVGQLVDGAAVIVLSPPLGLEKLAKATDGGVNEIMPSLRSMIKTTKLAKDYEGVIFSEYFDGPNTARDGFKLIDELDLSGLSSKDASLITKLVEKINADNFVSNDLGYTYNLVLDAELPRSTIVDIVNEDDWIKSFNITYEAVRTPFDVFQDRIHAMHSGTGFDDDPFVKMLELTNDKQFQLTDENVRLLNELPDDQLIKGMDILIDQRVRARALLEAKKAVLEGKDTTQNQAAEKLGYDVSKPLYRGVRHGDYLSGNRPDGKGVFLTPDPEYAAHYSKVGRLEGESTPATGVYYLKKNDPHGFAFNDDPDLRQEFDEWFKGKFNSPELLDSYGLLDVGDLDDFFSNGHPHWQIADLVMEFLDDRYPLWRSVEIWEGDAPNASGQVSILAREENITSGFHDFKKDLAAKTTPGPENYTEAELAKVKASAPTDEMAAARANKAADKADAAIASKDKSASDEAIDRILEYEPEIKRGKLSLVSKPKLKAELEELNLSARGTTFEEATKDLAALEQLEPEPLVPARDPDVNTQLDDEAAYAAKQMDEITEMEIQKIEAKDDSDLFADFDEEGYTNMTPEERSAMVERLLNPEGDADFDLDAMELATGELDINGELVYKTKGQIDADIEESADMVEQFLTCFSGVDE